MLLILLFSYSIKTEVRCVDHLHATVDPSYCLLGDTIVPASSESCHVWCQLPCVTTEWSAWQPCPTDHQDSTPTARSRKLLGKKCIFANSTNPTLRI